MGGNKSNRYLTIVDKSKLLLMKKLELKNLTVKKLTNEEKENINGGYLAKTNPSSKASNDSSCYPIACITTPSNW